MIRNPTNYDETATDRHGIHRLVGVLIGKFLNRGDPKPHQASNAARVSNGQHPRATLSPAADPLAEVPLLLEQLGRDKNLLQEME